MPFPTVAGTLGVPPPAFVRKLRRKVHWGGPGDPIDERAATAVREVFLTEGSTTFSVYLIKNDEELRRVAIGLNANRDSLTEVLDLVAFLPTELQSSGILAHASPGATRCRYANSLHHDLSATESQLLLLCRDIMQAGRASGRCSVGMMKDVLMAARKEQCLAVPAMTTCLVSECT